MDGGVLMFDYLYSARLYRDSISEEPAKLEDLKYFVRQDKELDVQIIEKFPINFFGDTSESLKIKGTKALVDKFNEIYAEKIDIIEKLDNIEYIGLSDKDEVILNFKKDNLSAKGVYDFTYDFFEEHFRMGKYATFCIKEGYNDIVRENVNELIGLRKEDEKQYRLIMKNDELFLRGLTSNKYNNYDNNLALYLSLLSLHKFAKHYDLTYSLSEAYLSDSSLKVILEQETPVNIPNLGKVFFGVIISNSEVRDSTFSFEIRYRIIDLENNLGFSAIPDLKDSVFSLNHITGIDKLESKLGNMFKLRELQETMMSFIIELSNINRLSEDAIYYLYNQIIYSRNFKAETKKNIKDLYDKNLISNTITLIEALNKVDSLVTDIDEKMCLERIYHDIIKKITSRN